uniref:Ig-like domain-containing protein n=1 Tax=Oryzias melastigma TaxID=30732 RepID=A0A3B3BW73_ORYME
SIYIAFLFQTGWKVKYYRTEICANKGSTVSILCSYNYPVMLNGVSTTVKKSFWFIRTEGEPVDLKEDPEYKDRVTYICNSKICPLRISGVRESDSAVYKFMFITNHQTGRYIGEPGVRLTVGDAPQSPTVSLDPPTEILEGSSVTLTCSSDANPAANYTWFKKTNSDVKMISGGPQFVFSSIHSTDSGDYFCEVENQLGLKQSYLKLEVKYAPKNISVSVNPPEILEGSSVTLTCSTDANPAANYTWFKENKDSPKSEEQMFTISDITAEDGGLYICVAQNKLGQQNSSVQGFVGSGQFIMSSTGNKSCRAAASSDRDDPTSRHPAEDETEIHYGSVTFTKRQEDPLYSNIKAKRRRDAHEDKEDVVYSLVRSSRNPAD